MFKGANEKIEKVGPKRLLAVDGGGMRGLIAIEILARIEEIVREQSGNSKAVLADYFDYVAGTSTGAIIGTCVALGRSVAEIRNIYLENGRHMFDRGAIWRRFAKLYPVKTGLLTLSNLIWNAIGGKLPWARMPYSEYPDTPLIETYRRKDVIGPDEVTLGSDDLRTLLMVTLLNANTDSPWPVSNNPRALYNRPDHPYTNANIPLWQLVRASSAAPTIFPAQEIVLGPEDKKIRFTFVDGGVTSYNNPAFQLFLQATLDPYRLCWKTGEEEMLLISVGTGLNPAENVGLRARDMGFYRQATTVATGLFNASIYQQDLLCRAFGKCEAGDDLDSEVRNLIDIKSRPVAQPLFTYARYNATLTEEGLQNLGLGDIKPADVSGTDETGHMDELRRIGTEVARRNVKPDLFARF